MCEDGQRVGNGAGGVADGKPDAFFAVVDRKDSHYLIIVRGRTGRELDKIREFTAIWETFTANLYADIEWDQGQPRPPFRFELDIRVDLTTLRLHSVAWLQ